MTVIGIAMARKLLGWNATSRLAEDARGGHRRGRGDNLTEGDERLGLVLFDPATGRVIQKAQLVIVDARRPRRHR
jgi:hypothetical protein